MEKFALASKYNGLEKNVWTEFSQLALEQKPLNLGLGLPEDLVPEHVLQELEAVARDSICHHQYTRGPGHPRLVTVLSELYSKLLDRPAPLNVHGEVLVTHGAMGALFCAIMGHVNEGDEVIVIEPYFDQYEPIVRLAGGIPKFVALAPRRPAGEPITSADWKLDPEELEASFVTGKVKAIIFNNPNNPLGKVYTRREMETIADLCQRHNVMVISDDVYEHMVYEGGEMVRMATLPAMWDRTVTIGSAGKTFNVTGWKLGWAIGPQHLIKNCQVAHQHCTMICPTPIQECLARSFEKEVARLNRPECYFKSISVDLQQKRDYVVNICREAGMEPVVPEGGYFVMADWSKMADKMDLSSETDEQKDFRFAKWLCKNYKLQIIPASAFFSKRHKRIGENYVRLCFIKPDAMLKKAGNILKSWRQDLQRSSDR